MQSAIFRRLDALNGLGRDTIRRKVPMSFALLLLLAGIFTAPAHAGYIQTNLVSDGSVSGTVIDPDLVNPWGMAASAASPFWVSDNGSGLATLYDGLGTKQGLVVALPPPSGGSGAAKPTGQVFNGGTDFNSDRFIFATEDGTISGWRNALGAAAELMVDESASGASYKGLAIGANAGGTYLFAANFSNARIEVFDGNFAPASLPGSFDDPNLPAGYAPFNVQNIGGELYVTYAQVDGTTKDDVPGAGHGFVDVFDTDGNFLRRLISAGPLNSPWGLALAPLDFGQFSNALLVGNSGDGIINAFDPLTGNLLGLLADVANIPISIDGLWALGFGNGGVGGQTNEMFFTAGPNDGANGLFGKITTTSAPTSVPEPTTLGLFGVGIAALLRSRSRGLRKE